MDENVIEIDWSIMDENIAEIDCSRFTSTDASISESKHSEGFVHIPMQKREAWAERLLNSDETELHTGKISPSLEADECVRSNDCTTEGDSNMQRNHEEFIICKKCLSNRNEFEKDITAAPGPPIFPLESFPSRKEICICAKDRSFDGNFNKTNIIKPLAIQAGVEHGTNRYTVFDLPDEIMLKIFSYFTRTDLCRYVAPVCQTWLAYARDSTLWEEITEAEFRNVTSALLVKVITSWCSLLKVLDLKGRSNLDKSDIRAIFSSCPLIEKLSFAFCDQMNDEIMKLFSDSCPNLRYISLEGCRISDAALIYLFGKPIQGLNVSHCNMISDEGVIFVAKNFDRLSSLDLDGVQWISQDSIEVLVSLHAVNLTEMVLDGAELMDNSIEILSQCCNIRKFSLSFCDSLTDKSLDKIKNFEKLKYLQLKKGANFTNLGILDLLRNLRNVEGQGLQHLNLSECSSLSDECLHALSQSCPNLVVLNLSWCWEVTDDGINFILDSCHKIKELHLCGLHELYGIPFRRVQREMPKLTFLDLRQCNKMSDDLLTDLASEIKSLTILNYYGDIVKASLNYWNLESKCSPGHFHHTSI